MSAPVAHAHHAPEGFIRKYVFSLDHKVIGIQYYFLGLFSVFVGLFLSLLMRYHMVNPEAKVAWMAKLWHTGAAGGIMTPVQRAAIGHAVTSHANVLIAGGTNSGKTTLANALLREITERCPDERIVVLEDTVELQCAARDHLALRTGPGVTLAELVRSALRTSPNRIVVGEVRGREALDLLDAWATGHPGGCGTCHATTADGALLRLDRLAQRNNVPSQVALIAEAVNLIAVVEGGNRGRRLVDLARVVGLDADGRIALEHLTAGGIWE